MGNGYRNFVKENSSKSIRENSRKRSAFALIRVPIKVKKRGWPLDESGWDANFLGACRS